MSQPLLRVERSLVRLLAQVRGWKRRAVAKGQPGWWVLACGEPLAGLSFEERDAARARLCERVAGLRIMLQKFVWIWDETDQVQLVLATLPSLELAERLARGLRHKGLETRVKRETP